MAVAPTVGVAETSPPVLKIHFGARELTLEGPILVSDGWFREFDRSFPAAGHGNAVAVEPPDCAAEIATAIVTAIARTVNEPRLKVYVNDFFFILNPPLNSCNFRELLETPLAFAADNWPRRTPSES